MRTHLLHAAILLSLALAGFLCTGYVVQSRIGIIVPRSGNRVRMAQFRNGEGRMVLYVQEWTNPHLGSPFVLGWQFRPLDVRRSLWEFDAHRLPMPGYSISWIFACPIWCLLVPSLIPPIGWWLLKRKKPEQRGFIVEPIEAMR